MLCARAGCRLYGALASREQNAPLAASSELTSAVPEITKRRGEENLDYAVLGAVTGFILHCRTEDSLTRHSTAVSLCCHHLATPVGPEG